MLDLIFISSMPASKEANSARWLGVMVPPPIPNSANCWSTASNSWPGFGVVTGVVAAEVGLGWGCQGYPRSCTPHHHPIADRPHPLRPHPETTPAPGASTTYGIPQSSQTTRAPWGPGRAIPCHEGWERKHQVWEGTLLHPLKFHKTCCLSA